MGRQVVRTVDSQGGCLTEHRPERLSCLRRMQKHRERQPGEWMHTSRPAEGAWPDVTKGGEAVCEGRGLGMLRAALSRTKVR